MRLSLISLSIVIFTIVDYSVASVCDSDKIGERIALPTSCSKYLVCSRNRHVVMKECPKGLHFNRVLKMCDLPSRAHCEYDYISAKASQCQSCDCDICCKTSTAPTLTTLCETTPQTTTQKTETVSSSTTTKPPSEFTTTPKAKSTTKPKTNPTSTSTTTTTPCITSSKITRTPAIITTSDTSTESTTTFTPTTTPRTRPTTTPKTTQASTSSTTTYKTSPEFTPTSTIKPAPAATTTSKFKPTTTTCKTSPEITTTPATKPAPAATTTSASTTKTLCGNTPTPTPYSNNCSSSNNTPTPGGNTSTIPPPSIPTGCIGICCGKPNGVKFPGETCQQFIVCENNQVVVFDCPNNLHYNVATGSCDFPENSNCNKPYQTPSRPHAGPSGTSCASSGRCAGKPDGTYFTDSSKTCSSSYVICQCECEVVRTCTTPLKFNSKLGVCDWPSAIGC